MRYAIVIEKAAGNYTTRVPDLPGCVVTGDTVEGKIHDAIRFHIDRLKADSLPASAPTTYAR